MLSSGERAPVMSDGALSLADRQPRVSDGALTEGVRVLAWWCSALRTSGRLSARDAVRALRNGPWGLPDGGVTINLFGGVHYLSEPLHLGETDSGTAAAPVIWRAAHAPIVILITGRVRTTAREHWHVRLKVQISASTLCALDS